MGNASDKIRHIGNAIPPRLAQIFAEHIKSYGFLPNEKMAGGALIGFTLTKASAMSPVLSKTARLLEQLKKNDKPQLDINLSWGEKSVLIASENARYEISRDSNLTSFKTGFPLSRE